MKTCTKCGEEKPESEFSKHTKSRDGLQHNCKSCNKIWAAAYGAANRDKVTARVAEWRAKNPEKVKASKARYYAKHAEKVRASRVKWYAENRGKAKEAYAKWVAANPEAKRIIKQNRRARERESGGKLSNGLSAMLFKLQRGKCACCGKPLGTDYHLDHRMPLALGGTNTGNNMQLLRKICNLQKGTKHPIDFMQSRGLLL